MGKGFNNYMCKKFFHPASADNLKRVWIAQKKAETEKNKQADLRAQYEREQELYTNKALLSKESKDKLELNFMYEPPPGVKKIGETDKEDEGAEPEYKFEWQKTWGHAPKESYLVQGDEFNEQPFGIQVCQAKCIKCGKYGHMNTDKRCSLYGKSLDHDTPIQNVDQNKLLDEMKAEGLAMRYTSWDLKKEVGPNHNMVEEEKGIDRAAQLKSMSKEEKKALLKKLKHMEKKQKKKDKKEKKRRIRGDSEEWEEKTLVNRSGSDSGRGSDEGHGKKKKRADKDEKPRKRSRSKEKKQKKRDRSNSADDRRPVKRERSRSIQKRRDRSSSADDRRPIKRERSLSIQKRRERSISADDRRPVKRERSNSADDRRPVKRERSRSTERRRDRSDSRERRRERSDDRERRRERSTDRKDRRERRSVSRDRKERRRERS